MKINALGFIEVQGLVAAIEAADAMVKAANVRIIKQHNVNPGMITVVVEGDVAACRAAVDAGIAAAGRVGTVIGRVEIPRPGDGLETLLFQYLDDANNLEPCKRKAKVTETKNLPVVKSSETTLPAITSNDPVPEKKSQTAVKPVAEITEKALIKYIRSGKQGKTYKEIIAKFKGAENVDQLLSDLVEQKKVTIKQMRYSIK